MSGFLRSFYSRDVLSDRSVTSVACGAAYKAVELGMLNLAKESHSIIAILAEQSKENLDTSSSPLTQELPDTIQFLYDSTAEETPPKGVEKLDKEGLADLEHELIGTLPYIADGVDVVNGNERDFKTLKAWVRQLESEENGWTLDATTGYCAMRLSSGLAGLLNLALNLNKTSEADEIMSRIAGRIHANQQSEYLMQIRLAWGKYFLSGWLRERLGLAEHELKEYAQFIRETTKKRLEEGVLNPVDVCKDKSIEEMLAELDRNTSPSKELFEEFGYESGDNNDEGDSEDKSNTILRKPATPEQIATAEATVGRPLPDDLKAFYTLTNGTRPVIAYSPGIHLLNNRFPTIQSLFWEDEDYMSDYCFDLLPGAELPISIDWPGIEGGAIAMYDHDGQGTEYVWYLNEELVTKAKKILTDAYEEAEEAEKRGLDGLVEEYHGSWEQLRDVKACWYQQGWGDPDSMIVFHNFREFLSFVVFESRFEEDKSPLKAPKED